MTWSLAALTRLRSSGVRRVDLFAELPSTNDHLLEAVRAGKTTADQLPWLVVAGEQTAGRGRGHHTWWSRDGALTMSLLIDPADYELPPEKLGLLGIVTALAVVETVRDTAELAAQIKWPNDILLDDRKLGGILVETVLTASGERLAVVGLGLNVNNSLADGHGELRESATSLCDELAREVELHVLLHQLLKRFFALLKLLATDVDGVHQQIQTHLAWVHRHVDIDDAGRTTSGLLLGTDEAGAVIVQVGNELVRCYAGTLRLS